MSPKVIVVHSGRQHSHRAALALRAAGMLTGYWAGVPSLDQHRGLIPKSVWQKRVRYEPLDLNPSLVKWNPVAPIIHKITSGLGAAAAVFFEYQGYWAFDRWAARQLMRLRPRPHAVMGYENSCLETFKIAKQLGIRTILDAAALHHQTQDKFCKHGEKLALHKKITSIKDQEIALADHVLVLSDLALQSYLDAGIDAKRLHKVALGVDTDLFEPAENTHVHELFKFIFVGGATSHKGIDLLFQAFEQVLKGYPGVQLMIIGHVQDKNISDGLKKSKAILFLGALSQRQLAEEYGRADCLILPSRHDSFGMVVLEALSSGLPVIVSDHVGAKDFIDEGKNGWIVPAGNAEMLAERMAWCLGNPSQVWSIKEKCRSTVLGCNWKNYDKQLVDFMKSAFANARSGA